MDFRRSLLQVRGAVWEGHVTLPKGGKPRVVPMTKRLAAALQVHRHLKGERVLMDGAGPVDRAWMAYWMRKTQRRANMPQDERVHILRHTYCSRLPMLGVPAMTIKELAGHVSIETTMRYMHLSPRVKGQAVAALDAAIEGSVTSPRTVPSLAGEAKRSNVS